MSVTEARKRGGQRKSSTARLQATEQQMEEVGSSVAPATKIFNKNVGVKDFLAFLHERHQGATFPLRASHRGRKEVSVRVCECAESSQLKAEAERVRV